MERPNYIGKEIAGPFPISTIWQAVSVAFMVGQIRQTLSAKLAAIHVEGASSSNVGGVSETAEWNRSIEKAKHRTKDWSLEIDRKKKGKNGKKRMQKKKPPLRADETKIVRAENVPQWS